MQVRSVKIGDFPQITSVLFSSFRQGSSLLWTHALRPFINKPVALPREGRSLVNDVCECMRD